MSAAERDKWDARYRDGAYEGRTHPTALLKERLGELPRGRALDVACGAGRNALFLAANGYAVTAVDISPVALDRARSSAAERSFEIEWLCTDLDDDPDEVLPAGPFELIVWVRYIHRGLMPHLVARLAPGGALLCEQHLSTDQPVAGPSSAAFRLSPGELRGAALSLRVEYAFEGLTIDPDGRPVALAQLLGKSA